MLAPYGPRLCRKDQGLILRDCLRRNQDFKTNAGCSGIGYETETRSDKKRRTLPENGQNGARNATMRILRLHSHALGWDARATARSALFASRSSLRFEFATLPTNALVVLREQQQQQQQQQQQHNGQCVVPIKGGYNPTVVWEKSTLYTIMKLNPCRDIFRIRHCDLSRKSQEQKVSSACLHYEQDNE
jgi:hypothetical protein